MNSDERRWAIDVGQVRPLHDPLSVGKNRKFYLRLICASFTHGGEMSLLFKGCCIEKGNVDRLISGT